MRNTTMTVLGIAVTVGVAGFAACGGSVTSTGTTTGTSATGTGGATASSHAVTGSVQQSTGTMSTTGTSIASTGSDTVAASSATGPMMSCDQACMKLQSCAGLSCATLMINCQMASMQTQCYTDCINAGDCNDLKKLTMGNFGTPVGMCLQGCMNMGNDGGQSCMQCAVGSCAGPIQGCATDQMTMCPQWLQCLQGAMDDAAATACDTMYMQAAMLYKPVYSCLCTSCKAECGANVDVCSH